MAFEPSFSAAQSSNLVDLIITDTSTGSDPAIVSRKIFLQLSDGSYLVPTGTSTSYISWPVNEGNTKTLSVLTIDYAMDIIIQWCDINGNTLYTTSGEAITPGRENTYGFYLTQLMAAQPSITGKADFFPNLCKFWAYTKCAINAVTVGGSISAGQNALNNAARMMNQPNIFFI